MKGLDYLKHQVMWMRSLQTSVIEDIEDEMLTKKPTGTTSSIGVIWLHMISGEDNFLTIISGEDSLWESEGWKVRFGLDKAPNMGEDWSKYEDAEITSELLKGYTTEISGEPNLI